MKSRARDDCHRRKPEEERKSTEADEIPVVQADHTTLGDQIVLSVVHTGIHGGAATVVTTKGVNDYVVAWFLARLSEWGCAGIRLRVQKDNPINAIAKRLKEGRKEVTILEEAPVASPQSIGAAERYHRALQEQCRALRLELEERLGGKTILISTPLASWIVRHASWLIFRYAVSRELKSTAYY